MSSYQQAVLNLAKADHAAWAATNQVEPTLFDDMESVMIRYAHFTAYTCPGIYRQGEPETLCSYVGSEDPPEYCPLHGGHYFVLRSQMIAQPRDPSLMGWQYGDES